MPRVQVTHSSITGKDATEAPKREPVPPGQYHCMIVAAQAGATKSKTNPLHKLSVSFQILAGVSEDGERDETYAGRRVFQDFILEPDLSMPDLTDQRRYELRMLLDATGIHFDDDGFDSDEMLEKAVIITVRHRQGNQLNDDGEPMIFTNVVKIDGAADVNDEDLV